MVFAQTWSSLKQHVTSFFGPKESHEARARSAAALAGDCQKFCVRPERLNIVSSSPL